MDRKKKKKTRQIMKATHSRQEHLKKFTYSQIEEIKKSKIIKKQESKKKSYQSNKPINEDEYYKANYQKCNIENMGKCSITKEYC